MWRDSRREGHLGDALGTMANLCYSTRDVTDSGGGGPCYPSSLNYRSSLAQRGGLCASLSDETVGSDEQAEIAPLENFCPPPRRPATCPCAPLQAPSFLACGMAELPLIQAVVNGCLTTVETLVAGGADVNLPSASQQGWPSCSQPCCPSWT